MPANTWGDIGTGPIFPPKRENETRPYTPEALPFGG